jgi:hypothetical protein
MLPLTWNRPHPPTLPDDRLLLFFRDYGRYLILALVAAFAVAAARLKRWDRYEVGAVTYAVFLVFAPGFGVQYTAVVVPLLVAAVPRLAAVYATAAGVFLFAAYLIFWDGNFPLGSDFRGYLPQEAAAIGVAAWGVLAYYLVRTVFRPAGGAAAAAVGADEAVAQHKAPMTKW